MSHTPVYAEKLVIDSLRGKSGLKILDFGCGDGTFTSKLLEVSDRVSGCDPDKAQINKAKKNYKNIKFDLISTEGITPYKSGSFDIITLMGVLEHVKSEQELMSEVHRLLKPNGMLYVYGINKGLFGFLDAANLKFVFPKLHKFLYQKLVGKSAYEQEFGIKSKHGMFGDFTLGKSWHTHYSQFDLHSLIDGYFVIKKSWLYSLFLPILLPMEFLCSKTVKVLVPAVSKLIQIDYKISLRDLSYCFLIECVKVKK